MKFLSTFLALGLTATATAAAVVPAASLSVPGNNPLNFCEAPDSHLLQITKVDLTPNPPEKGQDLLIQATGKLSEPVEEGSYVLLEVKWGLVKLVNTKQDLCAQLEKVDRKCPLDDGDLVFERTVQLPEAIPPGKFYVKADVYSKDDKKITCMEAKDIEFSATSDFAQRVLEL